MPLPTIPCCPGQPVSIQGLSFLSGRWAQSWITREASEMVPGGQLRLLILVLCPQPPPETEESGGDQAVGAGWGRFWKSSFFF